MNQDAVIFSFYTELTEINEYDEHEKLAFFGRLRQGLQTGKSALKAYSSSIKAGLKGGDTTLKAPSLSGADGPVNVVMPEMRQKGGLALNPDDMATLRQASDFNALDPGF